MRRTFILIAGIIMLGATSAAANPVSPTTLDTEERSCRDSMERTASNIPLDVRHRFCGCVREWLQGNFTQESLAAFNERLRAGGTTMQERDGLETVQRTCIVRAQQAPTRPVSAQPPAPPQTAPVPAPAPGTPLTAADLDGEERECRASMDRSAGNLPAETRQRFCGCTRNWMQRTFTRETLQAANARQRANATTPQDEAQMQEVVRVCMAEAQAPVRPPVTQAPPAPPPPTQSPAGPYQGAQLTADEQRLCLASVTTTGDVPVAAQKRLCGCMREWMTPQVLAGLYERYRTNGLSAADREQIARVGRICAPRMQLAGPVSTPPAAPAEPRAPRATAVDQKGPRG